MEKRLSPAGQRLGIGYMRRHGVAFDLHVADADLGVTDRLAA